MLVIANTSPLHYLVLIEHTAILPMLFGDVVIPPALYAVKSTYGGRSYQLAGL